jgi:hypothetical protein
MPNALSRRVAAAVILTALGSPLFASDPPLPPPSDSQIVPAEQPPSAAARLRRWWKGSIAHFEQIEAVQMVTAVFGGSEMGPGEGWFHAGQSRYGWDWLARRYDEDGNGVITDDEFAGPAELFERLDRDRDGELKPDDFDWSDRSPFLRQQGQAGQWFAQIDKSSNGRITQDEWQQFFEKLSGEKGYVSREDFRMGLFPPSPKSPAPQNREPDGALKFVLLKGLVSGELGSLRPGPGIDKPAPEFELETQNGKRSIRLSSFRNEKPVVLVFGSFT